MGFFLLIPLGILELRAFSRGCQRILESRSKTLVKGWGWLWKVPAALVLTIAALLVWNTDATGNVF